MSEEAIWEKCARQLPLNTVSALNMFNDLAVKIVTNIIDNSLDDKYRTIKFSNKNFSSKILPAKGGLDYFMALGFTVSMKFDGDKSIYLPLLGSGDESSTVQFLVDGLGWLT